MGASCAPEVFDKKQDPSSPINTHDNPAGRKRDSHGNRFTFVLNDKEILFSPSEPPETPSTSNKFVFNNNNTTENALSIPTYQLRNTLSIEHDHEHAQNSSFNSGTVITSNQNLLMTPKHRPNLYRSDTNASWDFSDMEDLQDEMKQQLCSLSMNMSPDNNQSNVVQLQTVLDECIDSIANCDSNSESDSENDDENVDDIMSFNDYDELFRKIKKGHDYLYDHGDVIEDKRDSKCSLYVHHHTTDTIPTFNTQWIESGKGTNLVQTLSCDWDSEDMEDEENQMKKHLKYLEKRNSNSSNSSGISQTHLL